MVEQGSGDPIAGLRVSAGAAVAQTDRFGRFSLGGLRPGRYRLRGESHRFFGETVVVLSGLHENLTNARIEVAPAVAISGKVGGAHSNRLGLFVHGVRAPVPVQPDGSFHVEGVRPGRYSLVVKQGRSPIGLSWLRSETIVIDNRDRRGLKLPISPTYQVNVQVVKSDGKPAVGLVVHGEFLRLSNERDQRSIRCRTDREGRCAIEGLVRGRVHELKPKILGVRERNVPVGEDVSFELPPLGSIGGRLVDRLGKPIASQLVRITSKEESGRSLSSTGTTDSAGRFLFGGLAEGRYRITVSDLGQASMADILSQLNERTVASKEVSIHAGEQLDGVEVRSAEELGFIRGVVVDSDGTPESNAVVSYAVESAGVTTDSNLRDQVSVALTDEKGMFSFSGVLPGLAYRVRAQVQAGADVELLGVESGSTSLRMVTTKR